MVTGLFYPAKTYKVLISFPAFRRFTMRKDSAECDSIKLLISSLSGVLIELVGKNGSKIDIEPASFKQS